MSGVPAAVIGGVTGTPTATVSAPIALNSDLLVSGGGFNATNAPRIAFSGLLAMNGQTLTFTNGATGQNQFSFELGANLTGDGTLINNSAASVAVTGNKAFKGRLVANRGTGQSSTGSFTLTNGGFTNADEFVINGYIYNGNVQAGGSIHSGNNSGFSNNPGQRWTVKRVTLNGGSLDDGGQAAGNNSGNPTNNWQRGLEYVRDDIGVVHFKSGYCYVAVASGTSSTGTILNVSSVLRSPGATAYVFGPTTTNRQFLVGNYTNFLIGAGGASGSQTQSVIPWIGTYLNGGFANPPGFGTYVASGGMRAMTDAEYATSVTSGASYNVSVTSLALTSDATVNALRTGNIATPNIGTNRTLTVASGGVFFQTSVRSIGTSGSSNAGTLSFGGAEGVIWVLGNSTNTIGARITGSGGLTKASTGVLTLTSPNEYSGGTYISGGALRVGDGTYAGSLGTGNVEVHAGATLIVSCANAIADSATLSVLSYGVFNGHVQLDAGVNETVKCLYLGGSPLPAGTYGSGASAAATKNDLYFAGTGVLTVSSSANLISRGTLIKVK